MEDFKHRGGPIIDTFGKEERVCLPSWRDSHSYKDKLDKLGTIFYNSGDLDDPIDYEAIQKKQQKWKQHVVLGWSVGTTLWLTCKQLMIVALIFGTEEGHYVFSS